ASAAVRLRSPLSTVPAGIMVPTFPRRSRPWLLTTAACGRLRSAPDRRTRRALLHLSYSCAPPILATALVTHDPERTLAFPSLPTLWRPTAVQGSLQKMVGVRLSVAERDAPHSGRVGMRRSC